MTTIGNDLIQIMSGRSDHEFIPLSVALSGKFDGAYCVTNRYWLIVEDHIVIYTGTKKRTYSPQCNSCEKIIDSFKERFLGFNVRVEFLPYVYIDGNLYLNSTYLVNYGP